MKAMKRIVVLGAGESGAGAAVLAKKEGFDVFVSDMSKINDKYKKVLDDHGIQWEEGHHTEELILNADEIIKSPGIPEKAPMIQKLMAQGTHIISEIEFAGRYTHSKMIASRDRTERPLRRRSSTISSRRRATTLAWRATLAEAWHCRWLRIRTSITSSS